MRKLRIVLGDLCYFNPYNRGSLAVPVNIGFLASYLERKFGSDVDVSLFKNPQELLDDVQSNAPDVVGLSFYYWNTALNHAVTKKIRALYGDRVAVVWGGPSVDKDNLEQENLFRRFPEVDAFTVDEGEIGLGRIVECVGTVGPTDWQDPIDSTIFFADGKVVRGKYNGLTTDLSEIDSPYLNGQLDRFLDGDYFPLLQTSRLCPYTCAFCVSGKNIGKLRAFEIERVKEEVDFVTRRFADRPHFTLMLADENFGILKRDEEIAEHIRHCAERYGYPKNVFFYNDKRFTQTSRHVLEEVGKYTSFGVTLALQTNNPEALKAVNRRNVGDEHIADAIDWAVSEGLPITTELIFGLPKETRESFTDLLDRSVEQGFDTVVCNALFLVDGIEMNRQRYRDEHGLETMFRSLGTNYGLIGDEFVCEHEEIVTSSADFSFEDWLTIRGLNFMFHAIFVLSFYKSFFQHVRLSGVPLSKFLSKFLKPDPDRDWPPEYLAFLADFRKSVLGELFVSPEKMKDQVHSVFAAHGNNVAEPAKLNLSYGARLIYREHSWINQVLFEILCSSLPESSDPKVFKIAQFLLELSTRERIPLLGECQAEPILTDFDMPAWQKNKYRNPLETYEIAESELIFVERPGFSQRITSFRKDFSNYTPNDYYYAAVEFFLPRSHLLYDVKLKAATTHSAKEMMHAVASGPVRANEF